MITRRNFFATTSLALAAAGCQSISKTGSCSKCGKVNFKLGMAGYSCNRLSTDETLALLKRLDVNYLCQGMFCLRDFPICLLSDLGLCR